MNAEQKDYSNALARYTQLVEEQDENEAAYIKLMDFKNADGSVPAKIVEIKNKADFESINEGFQNYDKNIVRELNAAQNALKWAEERLIDFFLSRVPQKYRDLIGATRNDPHMRAKIIELAYDLDVQKTKTMKEFLRGV